MQIASPARLKFEFGIIKRTHDLVPKAFQTAPAGVYVAFVVPDVDKVYRKAQGMGATVIRDHVLSSMVSAAFWR